MNRVPAALRAARAAAVLVALPGLVGLVGGCATGSARPPQRWFVLEAPAAASAVAVVAPRHEATLLLAPVGASTFYDSQDIVYGRTPATRGLYQYSNWTESPARRLDTLLAARLEGAGSFAGVVAANSGVRGRWLLRVQLDEIWHDAATPPGLAHVAVTAELTEPARRALVARRSFSAAVPVRSYDADGAVAGMDAATAQVLDELVAWVARSAVD